MKQRSAHVKLVTSPPSAGTPARKPPTLPAHPSGKQADAVAPRKLESRHGIEVHEQELGHVHAQCLYQMRCDCGRSWFELQVPRLVQCPACLKLCAVSI